MLADQYLDISGRYTPKALLKKRCDIQVTSMTVLRRPWFTKATGGSIHGDVYTSFSLFGAPDLLSVAFVAQKKDPHMGKPALEYSRLQVRKFCPNSATIQV